MYFGGDEMSGLQLISQIRNTLKKEEQKEMKKTIKVNGNVISTLQEGCRAVIQHKDGIIQTSTVVQIKENQNEFVHFETLNSIYEVTQKPQAVRVPLPHFLAMCA